MASSPSPINSTKSATMLAFVPDSESLSVLQRFALAQGWNTDCAKKGTVNDAVAYLADHPTPDFLLVDVPTADDAPDALDKLADVCDPNVKVIVTSTVDEYSFFRWLTEIGVHYYLLKPLTEENLQLALSATHEPASGEKAEKKGKLIALMGARGGVGTSTVALNLAAAIGDVHGEHTALLDLEPQWGTSSLMLDLEPGRGLREALAKPDRIDSLFMERVMLKYSEHLSVLSSEEPFDEQIIFHEDAASSLLDESRKKYPMTLVDVQRDLNPFTLEVLQAADRVIIVTELTLISLRDAMRLNDFLKEKLGLKQVHFIANRQGMISKYEMPRAEFEKSLGTKLYGVIPFDLEAYGKMASGELPVSKKTQSPMAKALIAVADMLHHPADKSAKDGKKPKVLGWLTGKK